jgi:signal peptidase II
VSNGVATTAASAWRFKLGGLRWVPLGLLVILLDQATKAVVESRFELFDVKPIFPFLEFTLLYNTGAAFSFLAGASGWQRWFFIGLGVVVSIVILYWLKRPSRERIA